MGKVFQLVILQPLYGVGRGNYIDLRMAVWGVTCVLTLITNCFYYILIII